MVEGTTVPRAALKIDGIRYEGWTALEITRSIETLCGAFTFEITVREYTDAPRWPLRSGAPCEVEIDGETVITGYIDDTNPTIDDRGYSITIVGRDRSADLVDCSAIAKPGSWTGKSIEAIAAELAKPFGLDVVAKVDTGEKVKKFALQQGETVYSAIERLARFRGLLAVSNAKSQIELIRPGTGAIVAELVEGENILPGSSANHDVRDRFSEYLVKGQSSGDDQVNGKAAAAVKGDARDPGVGRYRPMLIVAEDQATTASLRKRAAFEASTRAAKGQRATIPVAGWRAPNGELWRPDQRVSVKSPFLLIDGIMLITEVSLVKDERGSVTQLTVTPPEAMSLMPVPEGADASAIGAL